MITVHVVGWGMSPADLTPKVREILRQAQVLVGGRRLLDYFPEHPAKQIILGKDPESTLAQLPALAATQMVVVLASGDPNFYGVAPLVVKFLGPDNVVVHPNVTAVQAACARLKISWQDAVVVSLHGRGLEPLAAALGRAEKLIIYTDPEHTPAAIARLLLARGRGQARVCVLEDLGGPTERLTWLTPAAAQSQEFSPLNLVVVLDEGAGRQEPPSPGTSLHLGLPEAALAHEGGLVTKSEVRAVVLAKLALHPGQVLWDVGAGCGSVALEASLLLPGGQIFVVERDPARAAQIRANREKFGVSNLEVVCGQAPECLAGLPDPQRVFVGGGGPHLGGILQAVMARLEPGGQVVLTAARLESLETAMRWLSDAGWPVEVVLVQVSRSRPLGEGAYLQALNPVWIISGRKPEIA
jgi:precorrin-6Y C5,15-methyltransferase (decarboxylating)